MSECVMERNGLWHIADGPADEDATFRPILCGRESGEGIVFPGNGYERQPTCPICLTIRVTEGDTG